MKLSSYQVQLLVRILEDTCAFADRNDMSFFSLPRKTRNELLIEILEQQDHEIKDLSEAVK